MEKENDILQRFLKQFTKNSKNTNSIFNTKDYMEVKDVLRLFKEFEENVEESNKRLIEENEDLEEEGCRMDDLTIENANLEKEKAEIINLIEQSKNESPYKLKIFKRR